MKDMITYLNFDGNCREAMEYYQHCLGGELALMPFSEMNADYPPAAKDRIVHAKLTTGSAVLMASDILPGMPLRQGNATHICLMCESAEEIERLFAGLGRSGKVAMPLQDMFWGARFGMVTDPFGVSWMLNFEKPKPRR